MKTLLVGVLSLVPAAARAQRTDSTPPVRVNAEIQVRYVFSHAEAGTPVPADRNEGGFQVRRARVALTGSVLSPQLTFRIRPSYDRATGNVQLDDAWVTWTFRNGWSIQGGQFKPQFLREEIISSFGQQALERSYANDYFTVDYTQGVELGRTFRHFHPTLAVHDGSYGANTDFSADRTDFAVAGRLEWLPFGDLRQFSDEAGWSTTTTGLVVGVAADWEAGESDTTHAIPRIAKYTVDVSWKTRGASLAAAFYAQRFATDTLINLPTNLRPARQSAFVVRGGLFLVPDRLEIFARDEYLKFDGVYYRNNADVVQTGSRNLTSGIMRDLTVGFNWYRRQQNLKLSADVQYVTGAVPVNNAGGGLLRSDGRRQLALRTQAQFRF